MKQLTTKIPWTALSLTAFLLPLACGGDADPDSPGADASAPGDGDSATGDGDGDRPGGDGDGDDPGPSHASDLDGDLVIDSLGNALDDDGDGQADTLDIDGDGTPDGIAIDTDGDGIADGVGIDTDGDGLIDAVDTDGDGAPDVAVTTEPPSTPGVFSTLVSELPGGEPTACEWEWTVRTIHYNPGAVTPRRMYTASCNQGPEAKMFTSLTLGENAQHPQEDPSSGGLIVSDLDDESGMLNATDQRHFNECISMHGIAVSDDCQTIGVLCRIPTGTTGFDKDVLATHSAADWMTNPYECGDRGMNDEMWLFEWTNGDIQSAPKKYIVHKSIGSWEYGNNYLRLGNDDTTWGIGVKATVGGENGPDTCHEADAFLIMDRETETFTNRGWSWACGTGHTTFNRIAYDDTTGKYAALCSTDYNEAGTGGLGAYVFRMEDGDQQEFHYLNLEGIKNKGGASALVPRDGGGFLGVIVGVPGEKMPDGYPDTPGTEIGLVKWSASGEQEGEINWAFKSADHYLSYSTLSVLSPGRYLLGYGVMRALDHEDELGGDNSYRVPWEYWVVEIDEDGNELTDPLMVEGAGWGELDEMAPLGQGRAGWSYIDDPALDAEGNYPSCNQDTLQLSVYTSPTP
jgi:hypothetical protein